jgi:hypothetical protein
MFSRFFKTPPAPEKYLPVFSKPRPPRKIFARPARARKIIYLDRPTRPLQAFEEKHLKAINHNVFSSYFNI